MLMSCFLEYCKCFRYQTLDLLFVPTQRVPASGLKPLNKLVTLLV